MLAVARMEFIEVLYMQVEPRLATLSEQAGEQGIDCLLSGVLGGSAPGVKFRVDGVGELGYQWRASTVYRLWAGPEGGEPAEEESDLEAVGAMVTAVEEMLAQRGFTSPR